MLTKQDVIENKKRYSKLETMSFEFYKTAVLDSENGIMPVGCGRFLSLPENEIKKYLTLASDTFSNRIDDRMLSLSINQDSPYRQLPECLEESVEADKITERAFTEICEQIHEKYDYLGKLLVVAFFETWDVPAKSSDGKTLEDGDLVSKRILVSVAPITTTKTGLEYKEGKIIPREKQWIVGKPQMGFLWPSWEGREDQRDKFTYYTADPAKPGHKFMEYGLGTLPIMTATEYRENFELLVKRVEDDPDEARKYLEQIKDGIEQYYREAQNVPFPSPDMLMDPDDLEKILRSIGVVDQKLVEEYQEEFFGELPKMKWLVSDKEVKEAEKRRRKKKLSKLMKEAAQKLKQAHPENVFLADMLLSEAEKNERG